MPLHRLYRHYSELPYSQRVLYTMALLVMGLAYVFAALNLYHTYAGRAGGNPLLLSYNDIVVAYSGTGKGSRLESALRGPMSTMLPPYESQLLVDWVQQGSTEVKYATDIKPILDHRCMTCHDGSNPHLPNLNGYDNLKKVAERDTGTDVFTLVRVSHIHLFGLTFVFFIMGLMYQPCLRAAGLVQVHCRRDPVRGVGRRHPFLVRHEGLPSLRALGDGGRRSDGPELCLHVGDHHVAALVFADPTSGSAERKRRGGAQRRLKGE